MRYKIEEKKRIEYLYTKSNIYGMNQAKRISFQLAHVFIK